MRPGSLRPDPLPGGQGRRQFWPQTAAPSPSGAPRGPAGREGSAALRSQRLVSRPPRPRPRTTAARPPRGSLEEGPRPGPPRGRRGETETYRGRNGTQPQRRCPARPCPPPSRSTDGSEMAAPSADPTAAPAPADESPPPTAGPPSPARLPALLGHGPLHPSRLLTALRRIPLGGCAAILSELQSQDRPPLQPDWEAAGRSLGPAVPRPLPGRAARRPRPLTSAPQAPSNWECGKGILSEGLRRAEPQSWARSAGP